MPLHIIIDGYNLILQSETFSEFNTRDIENSRDALVDALAVYKRFKRHKITVVFDGLNAPAGFFNKDRRKGIHIRFSSSGESADTVIKRMAAKEREKALVVSSDKEIVNWVIHALGYHQFNKQTEKKKLEKQRVNIMETT